MSCNAKPSRVLSSWWSGFADRFSGGYGAQSAGLGGEVMEAGGFTLWSFCGRAAREKAGGCREQGVLLALLKSTLKVVFELT